jgi:hypothetical protein
LTGMFPLMGVSKIGSVFVDERGQDLSCEKPDPALQHSILNRFMVHNDPVVTAPGCMRLVFSTDQLEHGIFINPVPCFVEILPRLRVHSKVTIQGTIAISI